jgi:hypothetical protein
VAITGEVRLGGYGGRNQARLGWEMKKRVHPARAIAGEKG